MKGCYELSYRPAGAISGSSAGRGCPLLRGHGSPRPLEIGQPAVASGSDRRRAPFSRGHATPCAYAAPAGLTSLAGRRATRELATPCLSEILIIARPPRADVKLAAGASSDFRHFVDGLGLDDSPVRKLRVTFRRKQQNSRITRLLVTSWIFLVTGRPPSDVT